MLLKRQYARPGGFPLPPPLRLTHLIRARYGALLSGLSGRQPCSNRRQGIRSGGETVVELASITGQTVVNRRTAIYSGLAAMTALVLPGQVRAQAKTQPGDSFVVLLKGRYRPVTHGPNLGLSMVALNVETKKI